MFNNDSMNYYSQSTLKSALLKSYAWMAIALCILVSSPRSLVL